MAKPSSVMLLLESRFKYVNVRGRLVKPASVIFLLELRLKYVNV